MQKWRSKLKTVHFRILLFNMILVIIISLVPQTLYIEYFSIEYNKEIIRQSSQNMNKLKYAVDETILDRVIRFANIYFSDIPSNAILTYPLTHDISGNPYEIAEISNYISDIPNKLTFLQSVEVLYTAGNVYINDRHNSYLDSESSRKSLNEDWINELKNMKTPNQWLPPRITYPTNTKVITYLSNIPLIGSSANRQAVIAVNIKESAIYNLIQSSPTDGEVYFVLDSTGRVLIHSEQQKAGENYSGKSYIDKLLKQADKGTFEETVDGVRSVVSYAKSEYNDWIFVSVISIDTLYQKSNQLKSFLMVTTFILLLFSLLLSIIVTNRAHKPLRSVIQTILKLGHHDAQGADKGAKSELVQLHNVLERVSTRMTDLSQQMEVNKPIIRDKYIMRLLQGTIEHDESDANRMEQLLDVQFLHSKSRCMAIKAIGVEGEGLGKEFMLPYVMLQILEEWDELGAYSTIDSSGYIIFILHYSGNIETQSISNRISQRINGRFVIGFGREYAHSYEHIAESYREACECLKYSFVKPGQTMIQFEELHLEKRKNSGSGVQIIEQLTMALRNRNKEQVLSLLDIMLQGMMSDHYHIDYCHNMVFDAISAIRSAAIAMDIEPERYLGYDIREYGRKMDQVDEVTAWLVEVAVQIMDERAAKGNKENPGIALKRQILDYIDENIYNEISLTSLSEGIQMNASYLSRIYKSVIGINFSDHIAGIKMKHAERLLRESDLSIKEIAGKLGYSSPRYFAGLFKTTYGHSPKHYRDQWGRS